MHFSLDHVQLAMPPGRPAIRCDSLDELASRLLSQGFAVDWDENLPGDRRFYSQDPFGNRLEFLSR